MGGEHCTGVLLCDSFQQLYLLLSLRLFLLEVALHHKCALFTLPLLLLLLVYEPRLLRTEGKVQLLLRQAIADYWSLNLVRSWSWGQIFGKVGVSIFRKGRALTLLRFFHFSSYLIQSWTYNLFFSLREALDGRAKELKLGKNSVACGGCNWLVGAWAWLLVFVVDHFAEFGLEGVVGFVDLGLKVGFY